MSDSFVGFEGRALYAYRMMEGKFYPQVTWKLNGNWFRTTEYEKPCNTIEGALLLAGVLLEEERRMIQNMTNEMFKTLGETFNPPSEDIKGDKNNG